MVGEHGRVVVSNLEGLKTPAVVFSGLDAVVRPFEFVRKVGLWSKI
jgi:hypothetical protein